MDDKLSAIVDDTVETNFIRFIADTFNSKPDDELLPDDFDMNTELIKYLTAHYAGRTVAITQNTP